MTELQKLFTTYMKIALKNDSIDYYRAINSNWKTKDVKFVNIENYETLVSQECDAEVSFFLDNYLDDITDKNLVIAIRSLTPFQKKVLDLYVYGESEKRIAKKLNVSFGTVSKAIFRIKSKLKKFRKG